MQTPIETVHLLVQNQAGVLDRIVGQIRREGWNIKSLHVEETQDHCYSSMIISIEGTHNKLAQVIDRLLTLDCVLRTEIKVGDTNLVKEKPPYVPTAPTKIVSTPTLCTDKPSGAMRILTINPGSTSTKMAVYDDTALLTTETVYHTHQELADCVTVLAQKGIRRRKITAMLEEKGITLASLDAVAGRGGLLKPIESGTYQIDQTMLTDLQTVTAAIHASALGAIIAYELAKENNIPAFIVDPVVVDEMDPYAKLTGMPGIERRSIFHALNQKAIARRAAKDLGLPYENGRFVVAHMGGGITVGAHRYGRVIDVNDALSGEGPFTPERTGSLPATPLINMCFSGDYTKEELLEKVTRGGGIKAYLGTNELTEVERMIREGDEFAALVLDTMAYQVAKEIGAMITVLQGRVDAILLTGGMAHSSRFTGAIKQRVDAMAKVMVYPGEDEMLALMSGTLRVLRGEEKAAVYR